MDHLTGISASPVFATDRSALKRRTVFDFRDYGFEIMPGADDLFDVVPTVLTDEQCFVFFFPRADVADNTWSLFNLHVFLKQTGSLEDFARSRGASVRDVPLSPTAAFNQPALGYSRTILMRDLFAGAERVIGFLGGNADWVVRDSHIYFTHRYRHCYTGVLHAPADEGKYDALRRLLFDRVRFE